MPRLTVLLLMLCGCGEARFELQNVRTETVMTATTGETAGNVAGDVVNVGSADGTAVVCSNGWNTSENSCDGLAVAIVRVRAGGRTPFAGGYVSRTDPPVVVVPFR